LNYAAEFSAPRQHCPKGRPPARNVLIENSVEAESFEPESRAVHPVILARVSEGLYPGLRIRIDLMQIRIRIRHSDPAFFLRFDELKLKKIYSWKFNFYFFDQKLQFKASIKDVQATGKAFRPQKRTSITSKHENSVLFFHFCGSFLPS
jgi:hypothetical protein